MSSENLEFSHPDCVQVGLRIFNGGRGAGGGGGG